MMLDDFIQHLDQSENDYVKLRDIVLRDYDVIMEKCDAVISSKGPSEEAKGVASIVKWNEFEDLVRVSTQRSMIANFKVLAVALQTLDIRLKILEEVITKSGILDKAKDIEDIKNLKQLLAETVKKAQEERSDQDKCLEELEKRRFIV